MVLLAAGFGLAAGCDVTPSPDRGQDTPIGESANTDVGDISELKPDDSDADIAATPDGITAPTSLHHILSRHQDLEEAVAAWVNDPDKIQNGDWVGDYGDAPMYGPSYDLQRWQETGDSFHLERAIAALDYNRQLVEAATDDFTVLMSQTESVAMALLSLLEAGLILQTDDYHISADALLNVVDALSIGYGDYLDIDFGAFAANTYGPTSLTSMIAIMHLQHAMAYPQHDFEHSVRRAIQVLDRIHELTWDSTSLVYRISPETEKLDLYPSATTMLAMGRAFELTRDAKWSSRINDTYSGIQALRAATGDHYHSPYSAEYMGATDEDYSTLSSQNYLMLALLLGGFATKNGEMWLDIDRILGFLKSHLLVDGRLVHHWMNGRAATPFDKEYLCTGCNLQTLYLFGLLQTYQEKVPPKE